MSFIEKNVFVNWRFRSFVQYIFKLYAFWHAIFSHKNKRIALFSKRCIYYGLGNKLLESTKPVIASIIA